MAKEKMIAVTLSKSPIGSTIRQKACVTGLGLRKLNKTRLLLDTPANRGMIRAVGHLVKVEEVK